MALLNPTDTYFNFAVACIDGFAILFQLPLILIIINRITPLKPGKLLKWERYVVIGSFVAAAVITPTPDPFNQLLMAGPIIILYQLSIIFIWLINRRKGMKTSDTKEESAAPAPVSAPVIRSQPPKPAPFPSPRPAHATRRLITDIAASQRNFSRTTKKPVHRDKHPSLKRTVPGRQAWSGGMIDIVRQ